MHIQCHLSKKILSGFKINMNLSIYSFNSNNISFGTKVYINKRELEDALRSGISAEQIAENFNVDKFRIYKLLKRYNLDSPRAYKNSLNNPDYARIHAEMPRLVNSGYTIKEIMDALSVSKFVVTRWIKLNLPDGLNGLKRKRNM